MGTTNRLASKCLLILDKNADIIKYSYKFKIYDSKTCSSVSETYIHISKFLHYIQYVHFFLAFVRQYSGSVCFHI